MNSDSRIEIIRVEVQNYYNYYYIVENSLMLFILDVVSILPNHHRAYLSLAFCKINHHRIITAFISILNSSDTIFLRVGRNLRFC